MVGGCPPCIHMGTQPLSTFWLRHLMGSCHLLHPWRRPTAVLKAVFHRRHTFPSLIFHWPKELGCHVPRMWREGFQWLVVVWHCCKIPRYSQECLVPTFHSSSPSDISVVSSALPSLLRTVVLADLPSLEVHGGSAFPLASHLNSDKK